MENWLQNGNEAIIVLYLQFYSDTTRFVQPNKLSTKKERLIDKYCSLQSLVCYLTVAFQVNVNCQV